jgi:hypothetical protein
VSALLEAARWLFVTKPYVERSGRSSSRYPVRRSQDVICGRGTRDGQCRSADGTGRDVAGSWGGLFVAVQTIQSGPDVGVSGIVSIPS